MQGNGRAERTGAVVRADHPWVDAQLARLYDAFVFQDDLPFYLQLAERQGPRVLEIACGSGRVMLPLARAGNAVTGVDASPHMLALAQGKLEAAGLQAHLVEGDMRGFDLGVKDFDLAIVAVKSFAYLLETSDQLRCLEAIHAHVRPGGALAMDLLHPSLEWIGAPKGSVRDDLLQYVPEHGYTLSRIESVVSTDLARQVRVIRSIYETVGDDGHVLEKRFVEWPYRWLHRFEAEHLLVRVGFEIEGVYGGYERQPFTSESASMVLVATRPY